MCHTICTLNNTLTLAQFNFWDEDVYTAWLMPKIPHGVCNCHGNVKSSISCTEHITAGILMREEYCLYALHLRLNFWGWAPILFIPSGDYWFSRCKISVSLDLKKK